MRPCAVAAWPDLNNTTHALHRQRPNIPALCFSTLVEEFRKSTPDVGGSSTRLVDKTILRKTSNIITNYPTNHLRLIDLPREMIQNQKTY